MEEKHKVTKRKVKDSFNLSLYSSILFLIGIVIIIIGSLVEFDTNGSMIKVYLGSLIVLGVIVGLLNVTENETVPFLVSSIALVILSGPFLGIINQSLFQSEILLKIFTGFIAFIVPAALVVALKTIIILSKDE